MKNKTIYAALLALTITISPLCSCTFIKVNKALLNEQGDFDDNTPQVTKTIDISDFTGIECNLPASLTYCQSSSPSLTISASMRWMDVITTSVEQDGTLRIDAKKGSGGGGGQITITASSSTLKLLEINGSGKIDLCSGIKTEDSLDIIINGEAKVKGRDISTRAIKIETSGSSDFELEDITTEQMSIETNGASSIDCERVFVNGTLRVESDGSSNIEMDELQAGMVDVEIDGAGNIKLKGRADKGRFEISGAGNINLKEFNCPDASYDSSGLSRIKR